MSTTDPIEEPSTSKAGWSEADKRLLLITFIGGLGANMGLALIVGLAWAVIRLNSETGIASDVMFAIIGLLVGAVITGISIFFQRIYFSRELDGWKFWAFYAGMFLLLLALVYAIAASK